MTTPFDPITLGGRSLRNRIVMAPMSRSRAYGPEACPSPSAALYYRQRASAGLIVTEGIQPSAGARGYPATPGLYSEQQVAAWRAVTDAVHQAGGLIYAQLMHAGRIGLPSLLPPGVSPVGPSAIAANASVFTQDGPRNCVMPCELTDREIAQTITEFAHAALNAVAAGFDGVEIHGANGFLVHQFLAANANQRTDSWGGSLANRIRFAVELSAAIAGAIGCDRVGFQVSPANPYNDIVEDDYRETYPALAAALSRLNLAYLAVAEGPDRDLTRHLRTLWPGVFILNPHTAPDVTGLRELKLIEDGTADMIAFGALFLANPDLPRRLAQGGPFNQPDPSTYYGGGDHGYTDYPDLLAASQVAG
jgi:N-ethylmaleimide reductase